MKKVALITGGASGIGLATASKFASVGMDLVLFDISEESLEKAKTSLEEKFSDIGVHTAVVDISKHDAVKSAVESLPEGFKEVEVLVNNAGIGPAPGPFQDVPMSAFDATIDVNLKGTVYVTQEVLKGMIERDSGTIIFIGSIAAIEQYPGRAPYGAAKAAVRAFANSLRMDVVGHKIRVSVVNPGKVRTAFALLKYDGNAEKAKEEYEVCRPLEAVDIADAVSYIAMAPHHVQITEINLNSTDQASAIIKKTK